MIIWALRDHEIGDPFTRDGDAVEDDLAGAHLDRIAGKADHALDIILLVGGRRLEDDDIAAGRQTAEDPARNQRQAERERVFRIAVIPIRTEQIVADVKSGSTAWRERVGQDV